MGVAEAVLATDDLADAGRRSTFFIVLIAILVFRPQGLFGVGRARSAVKSRQTGRPVRDGDRVRRPRRLPVRLSGELGREHRGLHAHVRGAGDGVEPARRLLGLPVAGARGVLRDRRLRDRASASRTAGSARATCRSSFFRSWASAPRPLAARSGGSPSARGGPTFAIVTLTLLFVVAAARLQPALAHERLAGHQPHGADVPGGHLRAALLPRDARAVRVRAARAAGTSGAASSG